MICLSTKEGKAQCRDQKQSTKSLNSTSPIPKKIDEVNNDIEDWIDSIQQDEQHQLKDQKETEEVDSIDDQEIPWLDSLDDNNGESENDEETDSTQLKKNIQIHLVRKRKSHKARSNNVTLGEGFFNQQYLVTYNNPSLWKTL